MRTFHFLITTWVASIVTPSTCRLSGTKENHDRTNTLVDDPGLTWYSHVYYDDWNWMLDEEYDFSLKENIEINGERLGHFDRGVCDDCHLTMGGEYGWRFIYKNFGKTEGVPKPKFPHYILYNIAHGILRVFYMTYGNCMDRTYHKVSLYYASSSRANSAFTFSSEELTINDDPESKQNKEVAIVECACSSWCYVDLPVSYDPSQPPNDSMVYINIEGVREGVLRLAGGAELSGYLGEASISYPSQQSAFDVLGDAAKDAW